ncbi:hypoxanthine phosphoribosyltransferase [uncultured Fibrella sp.]|uniref:hypoxanthine phosphoribosyltransferase n=1 Tax=uncultured Fibrella sp. TaxID=1284596 RepID=UPI0035CC29CA
MLTVLDKTFVPFIGRDTLQERISELADQINHDYAGRCPLIVGVLNGAVLFTADLLKNLTIDCEITFIRVASYEKTASTGKVREILGLTEAITGRDLIVVEDIVDTGVTIAHVCQQLAEKEPASIAIATLLFKPAALKTKVDLAYVGFEIENQFVVGYGLDYDGLGRNTKDIFALKS